MEPSPSPPPPSALPLPGLLGSPFGDESRPRILVVDDDALIRQFLEDQLTGEGYLVSTAREGEEALAKVAAEPPDLILLDVMMPKVDGFEVCRRLKSDERTILIPVVMVTALTATDQRIKGIEAGADDFLSKPYNRLELFTRVRSLLKLKRHTDELENAETVLFSLALSVEAKDPYTNGHCDRLARYSVALGKSLGLHAEQLKALQRGGVLHDLGKIGVPESILLKPGPLNEVERAVVREHPAIGERICKPLKTLRTVLPIIRHHHERWDGSGYPDGLAGEAIPLTARIMQVADIYDAFTTERPYKRALTQEEAIALMREETAKGWWDLRLVEAFIGLITNGALGA
ncbi:MAG: response regulator [candidate division NC10 bacterium]|nr:response regulator [candidate division NC10 bacterium]MBI2116825.1 response regulator [candidate division NC10 bacterium]MBI2162631.1 response regulator [candidate division NC10 bacterium]MBI2455063.1 response regulator [candidate division NC10 bacterium]MBI3122208.1 response regulator [candidate division NC10 bacterium]